MRKEIKEQWTVLEGSVHIEQLTLHGQPYRLQLSVFHGSSAYVQYHFIRKLVADMTKRMVIVLRLALSPRMKSWWPDVHQLFPCKRLPLSQEVHAKCASDRNDVLRKCDESVRKISRNSSAGQRVKKKTLRSAVLDDTPISDVVTFTRYPTANDSFGLYPATYPIQTQCFKYIASCAHNPWCTGDIAVA
ncbi:hypothetical protein CPB84DRAFT_1781818 [Gymnopilus junonius]|uniref:Uncharacterized protein n=1 Tax=Gymnopilus junonius TaxID=109634 RepID=A0A9P5NNI0_GYMJU|nr:hypothetical protein CPB84DRAFT_1781818 [Gymnopilus junonius]